MQIESYKVTKRNVRKVIAQQSRKLRDNIGTDLYSNGTFAGLGYLEVSVDLMQMGENVTIPLLTWSQPRTHRCRPKTTNKPTRIVYLLYV